MSTSVTIPDCNYMDRYLDEILRQPSSELPEEARRHLETCTRCQRLYQWLRMRPPGIETPADAQRKAARTLLTSLQPVSPLPSTRGFVWRFLGVYAMSATAMTVLMGAGGLLKMTPAEILGIGAILAIAATLFAISLSWQMVPGSLQRITPGALVAAFVFGFIAAAAILFPLGGTEMFVKRGARCSTAGLAMAAPSAALIWLLARRGFSLSPGSMGATMGAAAGVLSVTVLQFTCPQQEALHLAVWHLGVVVISSLAGLCLGMLANRYRVSRRRDREANGV
jgi:hypothetical protein